MDYELYHDESKKDGFWHAMLLIPTSKKQDLLQKLLEARKNTQYSHPLSFKNIRGSGLMYDCADSWIQIGIGSLRSNTKGLPFPVFLGKRIFKIKQLELIGNITGSKIIIFRELDNLRTLSNSMDLGAKVETTFRIGLKGGLHFLGSDDDPINIERIHFDGHAHYYRNVDIKRIRDRLNGLRSYVSISTRDDLIDDRPSNHQQSDSQLFDDCQLIQLTDLLLGSFRSQLSTCKKPEHKSLSYPAKVILKRYKLGKKRMQYSCWKGSLCISQCYMDSTGWNFETIEFKYPYRQLELPGF